MSEGHTERLQAALDGRYRIERKLGEGGMATVYLAKDLRHNRSVALKVLKPELAAVVGAGRFLAEIETTANLQHPHILPLFDSGEADGLLFYVMPHVEGESLRARLDREHQLSVDEAVRIATNVAEALDYAHRHGVIHRDIKPANILLLDGKPVIADFGIALAVSHAGGGRLTETGLSLGTPHYMSPEQATGDQTVGLATDIWALGCVLYEMLVGEPPYTGSTPQAVLGKIVTGEADLVTKHRRSVPPHVDAAIRRALEKVPADRFGSAYDMAHALGDPAFRHGEGGSGAGARAGARVTRLGAAGWGVAAVLAGIAAWALVRSTHEPSVSRFDVALPEGLIALTGLDISPDGSHLVFTARGESDPDGSLYHRALDELMPTRIPGTEGAEQPRFSPDGGSVAFIVEPTIRSVSLRGTPPLTIVSDSVYAVAGLTWAPDGMIYFGKFADESGLWRVAEGGGTPEEIEPLAGMSASILDVLPNGRGLLIYADGRVSVLSSETGELTPLVEGIEARYASSGHIVYTSVDGAGTLLAAPFDADRLRVTGPSRTITEGLSVYVNGRRSDLALSETGHLVYRLGRSGPGEGVLVWLGRDGAVEVVSPELSGVIEAFAISPNGRRIAFDRTSEDGMDIWVYDLDAGTSSRLTFDGELNRRPEWSPDGAEIGFVSSKDGMQAFYSIPADGGGPARLLRSPAAGSVIWEALWTPDLSWLLYRQLQRAGAAHLLYAAPHADSVPRPLVETEFFNAAMSLSPDGRWLAYQSNESGQNEVYVRPFPGPGGRTVISRGGGGGPIWSRDGRKILYEAGGSWVVAAVGTDPTFRVESHQPFASVEGFSLANTIQRYDVSPDGERILAIRDLSGAPTRTVIVQNFFEELKGMTRN